MVNLDNTEEVALIEKLLGQQAQNQLSPGSFYNAKPDTNPTQYPEETGGSKQTGQLKKDPALLAKYSGDGKGNIQASIDENGQLTMSGQFLQDTAKMVQANSKTFDFQGRMAEIMKEPDLQTRESMLLSFQADAAEQQNKDIQKFKTQADGLLGVPQLRQQLTQSEVSDKADPLYYKYQSDSPLTTKIRNALAIAEERARNTTKDLISRDPEFAKNYTMVDGFVKNQQRILTNLMQKSEISQEKKDAMTSGLTQTNYDYLASTHPGMDLEGLKQVAVNMGMDPARKKLAAVVLDPNAEPKDYVPMALTGFPVDTYVIKTQSALTGQSPELVRADLEKMKTDMENDLAFTKTVKAFGSTQDKKTWAEALGKHAMDRGSTAAADWHKYKLGWVLDMQSRKSEDRLNRDINNWSPIDGVNPQSIPEIKQMIDQASANGKTLGVRELIDGYVTRASKDQQAERLGLVKKLYLGNADIINKGIYGNVKREDLGKQLDAIAIGGNWVDDLLANLPQMGHMILGTMPPFDSIPDRSQ